MAGETHSVSWLQISNKFWCHLLRSHISYDSLIDIFFLVLFVFESIVLHYIIMPCVRKRLNMTQLSEFERSRIISLREVDLLGKSLLGCIEMRCCPEWFQEGRRGERRKFQLTIEQNVHCTVKVMV